MFGSVFTKTLHDLRRSTVGWAIGLVALVAIMAAFWPSIRGIGGIEDLIEFYPEAMRELFNIEAIATGAGFLDAELFSLMLPALFIVHGVGRGARLVAGEEETGTIEALLTTSVTRRRVVLEKALALVAASAALGVVLFVATWAGSAAVDMGIGVGSIARASLVMVLLGLEHGLLALAVGAATGRRQLAVTVGAVTAVAGYTLYVLGLFVEAVEPWLPLSPFFQALDGGPLVRGGLPWTTLWMPVAAVVFVAVATPVYGRRDVLAH